MAKVNIFSFSNKIIRNIMSRVKGKPFFKIIPSLYFIGLGVGLVFTLIYAFIPNFVTCSSLFGQKICTPTGIFLALIMSLPGYIIAGNLIAFFPEPPWILSLIIVIAVSAAFYYIVGWLIDKIVKRKLSFKYFVYYLIVIILVFLVFILLTLIR